MGLLFGVRDHAPDASIIKLGTMGEYGSPLTGRPLFEGLFPGDAVLQYQGKEWSLGGELTPRDPVSFYHVSKVQGTYSVYEACKYWWLRSYDVMQGVIYGNYSEELTAHADLNTRLDIDEWWGTVVNRFVAQAVIGMPLTIYGSGNQMRGYITLRDAMQCITRLIAAPPEPGQYDVVNQVTDVFSVMQIAKMVAAIGVEFGLDVEVQRIENPRVEAEEHPYEVIHEKLSERFGFQSESGFAAEVRHLFQVLTQPEARVASCRSEIRCSRKQNGRANTASWKCWKRGDQRRSCRPDQAQRCSGRCLAIAGSALRLVRPTLSDLCGKPCDSLKTVH